MMSTLTLMVWAILNECFPGPVSNSLGQTSVAPQALPLLSSEVFPSFNIDIAFPAQPNIVSEVCAAEDEKHYLVHLV